MRITRGRVIKNIILIVFGIIMFGLGLIISVMSKELGRETFALFGFLGTILISCDLADWGEMTDPSATKRWFKLTTNNLISIV